ncbi:beta-ketoacyl-[acp] synthase II (KASII) [Campylobacter pinnipediorum subsp. caledonicus]|uniref:3-oxoacyl-[acyl-carrier-protein] synthase 2 n=1 Tax=Campylobacter pinnipediorum subsp. caledonicus TaxID=1874362 RepID=A0A1S6U6C6_9BACT|nr:beta-ketoacyl-ACP synthase II [Campylobacter pinnipediorum]AQW80534.1 beta-ketoacyl-[acp] synthase II (KASII) [Campylobacter pinnipediorum subsp. pinnipediorum]AQW83879.1 beta-ketoacyl-[acp] synthase II (KASII) [Campylobacter pinnipediorum subsp. pinnipediorum]AQW85399.1 beta-ketoacyl-[acp] synthase II (KASII) [Campylobacter pinnipediorum subsp. caledonicus]AQW87007.1 beta-ketoacyl-[acp] synthase II (KASII) [Campylobacter pinnipediorum subsp. caledonicus]OPA72728.1 beta-ketoacyl-ACP synthas
MKRVVVTGIGMITSLGLDKESSFKAICDGKTGVKKITSFDASDFPVQIAAEITDFEPTSVIDAKEVKKMDRFIQLGIKASKEAMQDANFDEGFDTTRFGVSSASGIGGLPNIQKNSVTLEEKGSRKISPFFIPSSLVNMLGGIVSINHGLKGPNLSSVTACAAGTHAITHAAKCIMLGQAKQMLAIGSEATICGAGVGGFAAMKALSTRNDEPELASRPFDADRDGFIIGEGAGALVLEELESAKARGAKIYAEIVGFGESGDAHHITAPSLEGPVNAMRQAIQMAGEEIKIDYVNAHGTSTPVNDKNETAALKEVFKDKCPPVTSTKGQTGHCLGGAGAIEAVISIMAIRDSIIPPTINQTTKDPDCDLDYVPNVARKADLKVVMSNSFGFGGTNGSIIFKKLD